MRIIIYYNSFEFSLLRRRVVTFNITCVTACELEILSGL